MKGDVPSPFGITLNTIDGADDIDCQKSEVEERSSAENRHPVYLIDVVPPTPNRRVGRLDSKDVPLVRVLRPFFL
jgi:hypothetical protein